MRKQEHSMKTEFMGGFVGGLAAITLSTPLELCKIRMNAIHGDKIINFNK